MIRILSLNQMESPPGDLTKSISMLSFYNAFAHVIVNGKFFLIRCIDAKTEKILGVPLDGIKQLDYHVDRILSRLQSKKKQLHPELEEQYRFVCQDVPMDYIIQDHPEYRLSLRIIRIELSEGCYENLVESSRSHYYLEVK